MKEHKKFIKDSKAKKLYFILFLTLISILILTTKSQANFSISNFVIDCQVLENGDMKVEEIPVIMHERSGGVSSISLNKSVYYMIKVTLAILIERIRKY